MRIQKGPQSTIDPDGNLDGTLVQYSESLGVVVITVRQGVRNIEDNQAGNHWMISVFEMMHYKLIKPEFRQCAFSYTLK